VEAANFLAASAKASSLGRRGILNLPFFVLLYGEKQFSQQSQQRPQVSRSDAVKY
jgi:hypothetical protein